MVEAYRAAGAKAELVAFGKFLSDAHEMLSSPESQRFWVPKVDAFLESVNLPSAKQNPAYLPVDYPEPSGYAAVSDVDAVPYLNDAGRAAYGEFLAKSPPRVFFITTNGQFGAAIGGFDPLGRAIETCKVHGLICKPYAIDDYVAWKPATPAPPETRFAAINDVAAVPFLNDAGRAGYKKYLIAPKPKAFVIAPDGAWGAASMGDDPLRSVLTYCSKGHQGCKLYAADNKVVWSN